MRSVDGPAIEYSGGGPHQFKHFVRECHRRGIAVLLDVVYNHFIHDAERAQWMYDSNTVRPRHLSQIARSGGQRLL